MIIYKNNRKLLSRFFISLTDSISSSILDNPYMFNYVRYILAGKQKGMKTFIKNNLDKYNCLSVADICSGTGDFAILSQRNAKYVGLDINNDLINFAKKRYKGHKNKLFIKENILSSRRHGKFDAVMLISTIHHFSDDELNILLPNVQKMVNKVVIIADIIPNPPHVLQQFFAKIDRGKFIRPANDKIKILNKYFKVVATQEIPTRSAVQLGIICEKKK